MGNRIKAAFFAAALGLGTILAMGQTTINRARSTIGSNFLFTPDNTFDIGASLATRPRTVYVGTDVAMSGSGMLRWEGSTRIRNQSDGVFTLFNNAQTDFARLQFGGTTSSFPALKRNGTGIDVRLADDSGYAALTASTLTSSGTLTATGSLRLGGSAVLSISATAPTVSSGFGTSPSIIANGTAAFIVNVGTGAVATNGVLAMPTAATGWACYVNNLTGRANHIANQETFQTASTTTTVTLENQTISTGAAAAWAASDILRVSCFAY